MTTSVLNTVGGATAPVAVLARESITYAFTAASFDGLAWVQKRLNASGDWRNVYRAEPGTSVNVDGPGEFRVWVESLELADELTVEMTENDDVLWRVQRANGEDALKVGRDGLRVRAGEVERGLDAVLGDVVSVTNYATPADAVAVGGQIYWPAGDHTVTESVPGLWDVAHTGPGRLVRGAAVLPFTRVESSTVDLYVDPAGDDDNDGLTADYALATIQRALDIFTDHGARGRWTINLAAGTYAENLSVSSLTPMEYALEIKGPTAGHPNVPTAIIAAASASSDVFTSADGGRFILRDLLLKDASSANAISCSRSRIGTVNVHVANCLVGASITHGSLLTTAGGIWTGMGMATAGGIGFASFYNSTHSLVAGSTVNALVIEDFERGLLLNEGAQGHLDYTILQDCGTGMQVSRGAGACNTDSMTIRRCGVGVLANGGWFNNGIVFGTGADANTVNVRSSGSAPEYDWRSQDYSAKTMRVQQATNVAAHTGTTSATKVYTTPTLRDWMVSEAGDVSEINLSITCPSLAAACDVAFGINDGVSDSTIATAQMPVGTTAAQVRAVCQHTAASSQRGSLSLIYNGGATANSGSTSKALKGVAFTYFITLTLANGADSVTLRTADFRTTLGG